MAFKPSVSTGNKFYHLPNKVAATAFGVVTKGGSDGSVRVASTALKYGILRGYLYTAGFEKFDNFDQSLFHRVLNDE